MFPSSEYTHPHHGIFDEEVTTLHIVREIKEVGNLSKLRQLFRHMAVHTLWSCVMRIEKTAQSIAHILCLRLV